MGKAAVVFFAGDEFVKNAAYDEAKKSSADVFELLQQGYAEKPSPRDLADAKAQEKAVLAGEMPELFAYDSITAVFPVWEGFLAPLFNTLVYSLPLGMNISVVAVSDDGNSEESDEKTVKLIERCGLNLKSYKDIKREKGK